MFQYQTVNQSLILELRPKKQRIDQAINNEEWGFWGAASWTFQLPFLERTWTCMGVHCEQLKKWGLKIKNYIMSNQD